MPWFDWSQVLTIQWNMPWGFTLILLGLLPLNWQNSHRWALKSHLLWVAKEQSQAYRRRWLGKPLQSKTSWIVLVLLVISACGPYLTISSPTKILAMNVIVVDYSKSMDDSMPGWPVPIRKISLAKELVSKLTELPQQLWSLWVFSGVATAILPMTNMQESVSQSLKFAKTKVAQGGTSLHEGLQAGLSSFDSLPHQQDLPKRVFLFSDVKDSSDSFQLSDILASWPEDISLVIIPLSATVLSNPNLLLEYPQAKWVNPHQFEAFSISLAKEQAQSHRQASHASRLDLYPWPLLAAFIIAISGLLSQLLVSLRAKLWQLQTSDEQEVS